LSVLVDAHVHLRACFDPQVFLHCAAANVLKFSELLGLREALGALLLAEAEDERGFDKLLRRTSELGQWSLERTEEISLVATAQGRPTLVIVSGCQIATAEGLEVLALGTRNRFSDGRGLSTTLREVLHSGAITVLPYGVGKWLVGRGDTVVSVLRAEAFTEIFLGDNGGRLSWGPESRVFSEARTAGVLVLPGSDPLPWESQVERVGGYGFVLENGLDGRAPAAGLLEEIRGMTDQPQTYGRRAGAWSFLAAQLRTRLPRTGGRS